MTTPYTRPPKLRVKEYFDSLTHPEQDEPPLTPEEARRQLGLAIPRDDEIERE